VNKPHFKNGKFYNNTNDNVLKRLKNLFHVTATLLYAKITRKRNKRLFFGDTKLHDWLVQNPCLKTTSETPSITWICHSTFLIQIGGVNIITDPVFFNVSPFFARIVKPTIAVHNLPKIDFVIISHNHRDHMDRKSLLMLKKDNPVILVPQGNASWLEKNEFKFIELSWWQDIDSELNTSVKFSFLPASHWTGRGLLDLNKSLWGSWMITHKDFKIYFAGDTAYDSHFSLIGEKHSNIDVALMPIAPNNPRKLIKDSHIDGEEAVTGFIEINATNFIPMHWGTFRGGADNFIEPISLLKKHWQNKINLLSEKHLHILKFGETKTFGDQC